MAVSKVILNGTTLIDTTDKTVTNASMLSGVTALKNDGTTVTGTYVPPTFSVEALTVTPSDESQIFDGYTKVYTINTGIWYKEYQEPRKFGWQLTPTPALVEGTTYRVTGEFSYGSVNVTIDGQWEYTLTQSGSYKYSNAMPFSSTSSDTAWVGIEVLTGNSIYFVFTTNSSISVTSATVLEEIVISKKTIDGYLPVTVEPMPSGTAGTPTATKGTVSNHSVSVTPSVTNTTGYITGGTKNGTAVTVTAAELESGTKTITENGTGIDVTGYAAVDVDVPSSGGVTVNPLSVTQNGTYTAPTGTAYSPVTVNVSGGGGSAEEKQVNFIDYDGTILYSYTAAEANALTELPANPSHSGLTAQGWNWTLAQIKAQLTALPDGPVWVGQMYVTSSGATEIDIALDDPDYLSPYLAVAISGTIEVDWGDGSITDTITGTSLGTVTRTPHVYAQAGNYTISIDVKSGNFAFYTTSSSYATVLGSIGEANNRATNRTYSNSVHKIRLGEGARIGTYAFTNCRSLSSITIPSEVPSISAGAFSNCASLTSITVPSGVTSVESMSYGSCYSLVSVSIPSSVTSILSSAFANCYFLIGITIPSGVTSIQSYTFSYCESLRSIVLPSSVTSIASGAFSNCYSLTSITVPSGLTSIGNYVFQSCVGLSGIDLPSGITSIGSSVFSYCESLRNIVIPSSVTSIGAGAFQNCTVLSDIDLPSGVTSIGNTALSNCYSLTSITVPSGLTSIGNSVFQNCYGVKEYHVLPTTPPTSGTTPFQNIQSGTKIYVPVGSLEAYQTAANWSVYASYMEEEPA